MTLFYKIPVFDANSVDPDHTPQNSVDKSMLFLVQRKEPDISYCPLIRQYAYSGTFLPPENNNK